ncbi:hypothetical protein D3C72_1387200 [compost metagenome]
MDLLRDALYVGAHARLVGGVGLVAAGAGVEAAHRRGRLGVPLRVGVDAVVQGVRVRADLDQPGGGNLAQLLPGQQAVARGRRAAEIDRLARRRVEPGAYRSQHRGPAVRLQDRQHARMEAAVAVIESQQHRARRERLAAAARGQHLVDRDRLVAVLAQPGELADQVVGTHAQVGLVGVLVFDVVVGQHHQVVVRPGLFGGGERTLRRRREHRDVLGAAGQQACGQQQPEQAAPGALRESCHGGVRVRIGVRIGIRIDRSGRTRCAVRARAGRHRAGWWR